MEPFKDIWGYTEFDFASNMIYSGKFVGSPLNIYFAGTLVNYASKLNSLSKRGGFIMKMAAESGNFISFPDSCTTYTLVFSTITSAMPSLGANKIQSDLVNVKIMMNWDFYSLKTNF